MRQTWGAEGTKGKTSWFKGGWVGLIHKTEEGVHSKQRQKHFQKQGGTVLTKHKMSNSTSSSAKWF